MRQQNIRNFIDNAFEAITEPEYRVTGFDFILDTEDTFNPYHPAASLAAGFEVREGQPMVNGFFYSSDDYEAYLVALKESGLPHPYENLRKGEGTSRNNSGVISEEILTEPEQSLNKGAAGEQE